MKLSNRAEALILLLGDSLVLLVSLWLTLLVRYRRMPFESLWVDHFGPFAFLMVMWLIVFFISGLYEKHTQILTKKLPETIVDAQVVNAAAGFLFFYLSPGIDIAPKINLVLYVAITTGLLLLWRKNAQKIFSSRRRETALLVGRGNCALNVFEEININPRYRLSFVGWIDPTERDRKELHQEIINQVYQQNVRLIVLDMHDRSSGISLEHLSNLMFADIKFLDLARVYEEVFDRIPSELLSHAWFLENASKAPMRGFVTFKRVFDVVVGIIGLIGTAFLYPFIALSIRMSSNGPVLCWLERLGERNKKIRIPKFRTMQRCDASKDTVNTTNVVTRVGGILRSLRIDELPQFWSVVKGDLSFIGPRPEVPHIAEIYEREIPHYAMRSLVRPGLTGWAQLYGEHAHHELGVDETANKLSYDLYYLKNRSIVLDLKIALKTLKTVISRAGR